MPMEKPTNIHLVRYFAVTLISQSLLLFFLSLYSLPLPWQYYMFPMLVSVCFPSLLRWRCYKCEPQAKLYILFQSKFLSTKELVMPLLNTIYNILYILSCHFQRLTYLYTSFSLSSELLNISYRITYVTFYCALHPSSETWPDFVSPPLLKFCWIFVNFISYILTPFIHPIPSYLPFAVAPSPN